MRRRRVRDLRDGTLSDAPALTGDAAQILEDRQPWSSAAGIYEKLANTRGAGSEEARNRLIRLGLEHFYGPLSEQLLCTQGVKRAGQSQLKS